MNNRFLQKYTGELYLGAGILIWSWFPIVGIIALESVPPLFTAAMSTFFAAVFFAIIITFRRKWGGVFKGHNWKDIFMVTLFISIGVYGFLFFGLQFSTAGNASILFLSEILFSFVILGMWGKEKVTREALLGAGLMVGGAVLVLMKKSFVPNIGDIFIVTAFIFAPLGNYFQQKLRRQISSEQMMFLRSILGFPFLLMFSFMMEDFSFSLGIEGIILLIVLGIIFFGFQKVCWLEAIHRLPITKAVTVNTLKPALTLVFAYFVLNEIPTVSQLTGFLPMLIGVWFIIRKKNIFKLLH